LKTVKVAAAIIKNERGQILICQRGAGGNCAYLWEFPGGKLEAGESLEGCLMRECLEELEIAIEVEKFLVSTKCSYPDREVEVFFYWAKIVNGALAISVHKDYKWIDVLEMDRYDFCPADRPVVRMFKNGSLGL
jgi:8-oxo-dGTP diphosphatase